MFNFFKKKVTVDCKILAKYCTYNPLTNGYYYHLTLGYKDKLFTTGAIGYGLWIVYKVGDTIKYKIRKKYV